MTTDRRTILITGGAGYLGAHLVRRLLARGDRVRVLDAFLYGDHGLKGVMEHAALTVLAGDVRDAAAVYEAASGADVVIALAALVGEAACDVDRDAAAAINCDGAHVLAEVCVTAGVRRLVFASSCSVYGAGIEPVLVETSTPAPLSFYARTRVDAERIIDSFSERLSIVTLRLPTLFGRSARMRLDLLVNRLSAEAYFQHRLRMPGGSPGRAAHLHVQDAVTAFLLAAEAPEPLVRGQRFNVGDDAARHTPREVAALVEAALPGIDVEPERPASGGRDVRVSFVKIRKALGFVARRSVADGITEVIAACRSGEIRPLDDARQSNAETLRRSGVPDLVQRAA
ncbi:MAG TPA: NAD(P)-dependent oxidoreductase [Methylomirabilota bacterium]|nr:NAD(P)-dependent oxidoreductase [Methylomirabilota bacterium]